MFQLFLVPVHFKFELVHALVCFEDHILNVIETVLLISYALLKLFNFVLESTRLALGNLLHVFFSLNFLVFGIYETLSVDKLHLDRLEMLCQNLKTFLMFFDFETELGNQTHLFAHNLVQLFILVVGIRREVLVEVILGYCVYNVVCHDEIL